MPVREYSRSRMSRALRDENQEFNNKSDPLLCDSLERFCLTGKRELIETDSSLFEREDVS